MSALHTYVSYAYFQGLQRGQGRNDCGVLHSFWGSASACFLFLSFLEHRPRHYLPGFVTA